VIFDRLEAVLKADDMSLADIARITTFLTEVDDQEAYKRVRDRVLGDHKPANPILIVKALVRPLLKVEIEIIAAKVD
jgi:2-iminobutanoate/2-iminopropanoate deaminase